MDGAIDVLDIEIGDNGIVNVDSGLNPVLVVSAGSTDSVGFEGSDRAGGDKGGSGKDSDGDGRLLGVGAAEVCADKGTGFRLTIIDGVAELLAGEAGLGTAGRTGFVAISSSALPAAGDSGVEVSGTSISWDFSTTDGLSCSWCVSSATRASVDPSDSCASGIGDGLFNSWSASTESAFVVLDDRLL